MPNILRVRLSFPDYESFASSDCPINFNHDSYSNCHSQYTGFPCWKKVETHNRICTSNSVISRVIVAKTHT